MSMLSALSTVPAGVNLTPQQIKKRLLESVDKVPALAPLVASGGRLNISKVVQGARPVWHSCNMGRDMLHMGCNMPPHGAAVS